MGIHITHTLKRSNCMSFPIPGIWGINEVLLVFVVHGVDDTKGGIRMMQSMCVLGP